MRPGLPRQVALLVAALGVTAARRAVAEGDQRPFRLYEAVGAPEWLRFGLDQRTRFEHLANDFRAPATGDSAALSLRTLVSAELRRTVVVGAELQDSRAYATDETPLATTVVDAVELLQAYGGLRATDLLATGDQVALTLGRQTIDLGSRRLVARNEFRNTINAFTGVDIQWTSPTGHVARAFVVVPVLRLPTDAPALSRNVVQLDRENTDAVLGGLFYASPFPLADTKLELYLLELHEGDGDDAPSTNRRLFTPGLRVLRAPAPGRFDFQVEGILQVGTSRATTAAEDTADLDHQAFSLHVSVGYRAGAPWTPRVVLQLDHASGDASPDDDTTERFDPLFGARRFELGPTGLFGALARSNLTSPGLRLEVAPHPTVEALVCYRLAWLASARDAWTTAGVRDSTGASGSFLGHQLEARVRWQLFPKNLTLELGGAVLGGGAFAENAPNARPTPAVHGYGQVLVTL